MTRPIKFRGFYKGKKTQTWVYGFYYKVGEEHWIRSENVDFLVEPESVGQDTGLKDKNGKEIWEGDVITSDEGAKATYEVIFHKGSFCVPKLGAYHLFNDKKVEVIGNIYLTPDLIK